MPPVKTSINLTKSAEFFLERNQHLRNKSARISQIIDRYGMLLRSHRNEELLAIAQNRWVTYCVSEWAEVYPVPATSLRTLLQIVVNEMEGSSDIPDAAEMNQLFEATAHLTPVEQMVIVEEIESRV